jgi:hypothetical protein
VDFRPVVDGLFNGAIDRFEKVRQNPVTGGRWLSGVDPVARQKRDACRALVARAGFAWENPGLPPLPLSYDEREAIKGRSGLEFIISVYARSLEARKYDRVRHPPFEQYARGVLASDYAPHFIKDDPDLIKRYPPRMLPGLGPGLCWKPSARRSASLRRGNRR